MLSFTHVEDALYCDRSDTKADLINITDLSDTVQYAVPSSVFHLFILYPQVFEAGDSVEAITFYSPSYYVQPSKTLYHIPLYYMEVKKGF